MMLWCLVLVLAISPDAATGLASTSSFFLAKTSETFKLSELQYAEARGQASMYGYTVTRLLVDRSTGSTILKVKHVSSESFLDPMNIPSSIRRCDWILEVLAQSETPHKLMKDLGSDCDPLVQILDGWTLDYFRFEDLLAPQQTSAPNYTMKTLMCSVSQAIPSLPALDPKKSVEKLLLVDATSYSDHTLFLGKVLDLSRMGGSESFSLKSWSMRPYQYSSAFNQKAAEIVMDWLSSRVQLDSRQIAPLLLDPTCGSGTFLALAMGHGWRVEGYDVNSYCAEGSLRNLKHMFGDERVQQMAHVECRDSSSEFNKNEFPAGVVSNLPWGVNSVEYQNENQKILASVHARLKAGTPCVFMTKNAELKLFQDAGYAIVAQARIPPHDFKLPKSRKMVADDGTHPRNERNHCFVTMATSI
jgi:hypothetical protein